MDKSQNLSTFVSSGVSYSHVLPYHMVLSYTRVSTVWVLLDKNTRIGTGALTCMLLKEIPRYTTLAIVPNLDRSVEDMQSAVICIVTAALCGEHPAPVILHT